MFTLLCLASFIQDQVLRFIHDVLFISNPFIFIVESFLFVFLYIHLDK